MDLFLAFVDLILLLFEGEVEQRPTVLEVRAFSITTFISKIYVTALWHRCSCGNVLHTPFRSNLGHFALL